MKRFLMLLMLFIILTFCGCLVYNMMDKNIPLLIANTVTSYRINNTLLLFFHYLPAVLCSGFVVILSVMFCRAQGGTVARFSSEIFSLYKYVFATSLITVIILTAVTQIFRPICLNKKDGLERQPYLFNEYMILANKSMSTGDSVMAFLYADRALTIDPASKQAADIKRSAELLSESVDRAETDETEKKSTEKNTDDSQPMAVYELLKKSREAAAQGKWFNAHYYAQLAVQTAAPTDINLTAAKEAAAEAWNKLSEMEKLGDDDVKAFFTQKKNGYAALMDGDNLKAYYIFDRLSSTSKAAAADPDVQRYLALSKDRLADQAFFIDETYNLQRFENINNMYFCFKDKDGATFVVWIRGVTNMKNNGNLVRYLRGLTVCAFDPQGHFAYSLSVPYAKMLAENDSSHESAGMVPYILLRSVDRKKEGIVSLPEYHYSGNTDRTDGEDILVLPMPYEDIELIADTSAGPEQMDIFSLLKFVPKASLYGFSSEVYGLALENRLLYPFEYLILLIFLASVAWNYRLLGSQVFKFKWIFWVPVFAFIMYFILTCVDSIFTLLNFTSVGLMGQQSALSLTVVIYIVLFFTVSVLFVSRKS